MSTEKYGLFNPDMFRVANKRRLTITYDPDESAYLCAYWFAATGNDVIRRGSYREDTERFRRVLYRTLANDAEDPNSAFYSFMREEGVNMDPKEIISRANEIMNQYKETDEGNFVSTWRVLDALKNKEVDTELDSNAKASGLY